MSGAEVAGLTTERRGAVLVLVPSLSGDVAPVQRHAGLQSLQTCFAALRPDADFAMAGAVAMSAPSVGGLVEVGRRLLMTWQGELGARLGIDMASDPRQPTASEIHAAEGIARRVPLGLMALSAEAADRLERAWEFDLVDLGPAPGEVRAESRGNVLALAPQDAVRTAEALSLRDVLVIGPPQLSGTNPLQQEAVADLLADTVIGVLVRSSLLKVVARESVARLGDQSKLVQDAFGVLHGSHLLLLRGHLGETGTLALQLELLTRGSTRALWSARIAVKVEELLAGEARGLLGALADVHSAILSEALDVAQQASWSRLEDHRLLIGATQLMHRLSPASFERSRQLLEGLVQRVPEQARVHAWMAKWHVFAVVQWVESSASGLPAAMRSCDEALRLDPHCSLAWALGGFTRLMQGQSLAQARSWLERAVQVNPNESLAWVFLALLRTYEDRLDEALEALQLGIALSPLDPWRYFFDSVAAHVHLARGEWAEGALHAEASARQRARHAPTLIYLAIAHARLGRLDAAQAHLRQLLELWPRYTLERFWHLYPGKQAAHAREFAWALTAAGLPSGQP